MTAPTKMWAATMAMWLALSGSAAWALDNPDAPDRVAAFSQRMQPLQDAFATQTTQQGLAAAGAAYAKALDAELNRSYQQLLGRLDASAAEKLRISQRAWLAHIKAETAFIDANWTPAHFGSSSALSRIDYRNTLVRERVVVLLRYLQNY